MAPAGKSRHVSSIRGGLSIPPTPLDLRHLRAAGASRGGPFSFLTIELALARLGPARRPFGKHVAELPLDQITPQRLVLAQAARLDQPEHQAVVRRDLWRYVEIGPDGAVLAEETREMELRWTYRWELHHLLNLCGLAVDVEYSDFAASAPAYGKELIVVARAG